MRRIIPAIAIITVLGFTFAADEEKANATKIAMKKVNGKGGYAVVINNELAKDQPDWDKISKASQEMTPLIEAMVKTTRKGENAGKWTEHTKAYLDENTAFAKTVTGKDKEASTKAFAGLKNCRACHTIFAGYMPGSLPKE